MSKARSDQAGGTRAILGDSKNKLDAITGKGQVAEEEPTQEAVEPVDTKPKRIRKTISISVDTVLAIKRIQEQRLINDGKQPTDSALIEEAVMALLKKSKLNA